MIFIERVCRQLAGHNIPYAIVGGHAVALHGAVRGTLDLDFVIQWNQENLVNAERALIQLGLRSLLPSDAEDVFKSRAQYIK